MSQKTLTNILAIGFIAIVLFVLLIEKYNEWRNLRQNEQVETILGY